MGAAENKCARSACANDHEGCTHTQTGRRYCRPCAHAINDHNPELVTTEAMQMQPMTKNQRRMIREADRLLDVMRKRADKADRLHAEGRHEDAARAAMNYATARDRLDRYETQIWE